MEFEGTLRLNKTKKGMEHKAEFTNQKGRTVAFVVPEHTRYYSDRVTDSDPCLITVEGSSVIKCVVPGKEQEPRISAPKRQAPRIAARPEPVTGTAPYNFVPYEDYAIAPPADGEARRWSGEIICSLEALTPLLVSGRQTGSEYAAADCRFMQVAGKNIIPGTAVKGMLRSLVEILAFSGLQPVTRKKLFWREVAEPFYTQMFPGEPLGGFLRKRGADYFLRPARVTPADAEAAAPAGTEKVRTGGFPKKGGGSSRSYFFDLPVNDAPGEALDVEIVRRLMQQMTPKQEALWPEEKREKRMKAAPGLPVFYRTDEDGKIAELGFCRFFRLEYKYSPYDLAWPDEHRETGPDIAETIFGYAGKKSAIRNLRGRIAIEPFGITGTDYRPGGVHVVLGGPKPTCLPFYLVQNPDDIMVISGGSKNKRTPPSMRNYNEKTSRLRGRKLYWHHDMDERSFLPEVPEGNANIKTRSCLHPLAAGATGQFRIHVDHLADTELGCLFEALELREASAHRLGMGRSLGFGSVRIRILAASLADSRQKYQSLNERLKRPVPADMGATGRAELRELFRRHIFEAIRARWPKARDYYDLPPIRDLFLMLDWQRRPAPAAVATMKLEKFRANPLLPLPQQVLNGRR